MAKAAMAATMAWRQRNSGNQHQRKQAAYQRQRQQNGIMKVKNNWHENNNGESVKRNGAKAAAAWHVAAKWRRNGAGSGISRGDNEIMAKSMARISK